MKVSWALVKSTVPALSKDCLLFLWKKDNEKEEDSFFLFFKCYENETRGKRKMSGGNISGRDNPRGPEQVRKVSDTVPYKPHIKVNFH